MSSATFDASECDPPLRTRVTAAEMREPGGAAEEGNAGNSHDASPLERIRAGVVNEAPPPPPPSIDPPAASPAVEAATCAATSGAYHDDDDGEGEGVGGGAGGWSRRVSLSPPGVRTPPHTVNAQYASPVAPPAPFTPEPLSAKGHVAPPCPGPASCPAAKPHPRSVNIDPACAAAAVGHADSNAADRYKICACSARYGRANDGGVKLAGRIFRCGTVNGAGFEQQLIPASQNSTVTAPPGSLRLSLRSTDAGAAHVTTSAETTTAGDVTACPPPPLEPKRHTALLPAWGNTGPRE